MTLDREQLWDHFIDLLAAYAQSLGVLDVFAFTAAMHRTPSGKIADEAYAQAYYELFPHDRLPAWPEVWRRLARFVDDELVGWWNIGAARRISDDLRALGSTGEASAEPLRSWVEKVRSSGA